MSNQKTNQPQLSDEQKMLLKNICQLDIPQQQKFAAIQFKLAMFFLGTGIIAAFFVEEWVLTLAIGQGVGVMFLILSRASHGFCELNQLIQTLQGVSSSEQNNAASEDSTES